MAPTTLERWCLLVAQRWGWAAGRCSSLPCLPACRPICTALIPLLQGFTDELTDAPTWMVDPVDGGWVKQSLCATLCAPLPLQRAPWPPVSDIQRSSQAHPPIYPPNPTGATNCVRRYPATTPFHLPPQAHGCLPHHPPPPAPPPPLPLPQAPPTLCTATPSAASA